MKDEQAVRAALERLKAHDEHIRTRRVTQSYKLGVYMTIETLEWVLGQHAEHAHQPVLDGS